MYLTYVDYQNMGGTLDETTFNECEFEAECLVNLYTYHRLEKESEENYPPALSKCVYALIKLIKAQEALIPSYSNEGTVIEGGRQVQSQSNDGVSISYVTLSASDLLDVCGNKILNIIQTYLDGVLDSLGHKLLYKGIYPDE